MDLILQGTDVETGDLKAIAKIAQAQAIERITARAFRLKSAGQAPEIPSLCESAKLDHGYVPTGRQLSDFRLLVMDMDSTLITIETIDELADLVGLKPQVA